MNRILILTAIVIAVVLSAPAADLVEKLPG
jgi:cathepsin A (carboxypeptidase C)